MPSARSTGRVKNPSVHGGLVAGADVGSQQQEFAEVGQLKVQLRSCLADLSPARSTFDVQILQQVKLARTPN